MGKIDFLSFKLLRRETLINPGLSTRVKISFVLEFQALKNYLSLSIECLSPSSPKEISRNSSKFPQKTLKDTPMPVLILYQRLNSGAT